MIRTTDSRLEVSGGMTLEVASRLLAEGSAVVASRDMVVDLAGVEAVDSSALAVIFGWMRAAKQQGRAVKLVHPPTQLMSLAELYGVAELLPLTA
jgi:phospholipid transport system transporter-binding protein